MKGAQRHDEKKSRLVILFVLLPAVLLACSKTTEKPTLLPVREFVPEEGQVELVLWLFGLAEQAGIPGMEGMNEIN
ncbi:MAG: hypothetical protein PUC30_04280 [Lachnospiraceae bacterium]|nr:hypothetical protein [Lachnospiraceae bacterium]